MLNAGYICLRGVGPPSVGHHLGCWLADAFRRVVMSRREIERVGVRVDNAKGVVYSARARHGPLPVLLLGADAVSMPLVDG